MGLARAAAAAAAGEARAALAMATWSVPVDGAEARPKRLYVAVDGVMAHRGQWNEAKCVTCYWDAEPTATDKGSRRREARHAVRFESAEQFPFDSAQGEAFAWALASRLPAVPVGPRLGRPQPDGAGDDSERVPHGAARRPATPVDREDRLGPPGPEPVAYAASRARTPPETGTSRCVPPLPRRTATTPDPRLTSPASRATASPTLMPVAAISPKSVA